MPIISKAQVSSATPLIRGRRGKSFGVFKDKGRRRRIGATRGRLRMDKDGDPSEAEAEIIEDRSRRTIEG